MPMTLVSLTEARLPLPSGVPLTSMWTTVSAAVCASTRAMVGCRMSARTNSASPRSCSGSTASTATTRSTSGSRPRRRTNLPASGRATPVTSTTFPKTSAFPSAALGPGTPPCASRYPRTRGGTFPHGNPHVPRTPAHARIRSRSSDQNRAGAVTPNHRIRPPEEPPGTVRRRLWPPSSEGRGATEHAATRRVRYRMPCTTARLLLVAALHSRALQQLAVLLLGHPLAPLLDNRAHDYPRSLLITRCWAPWAHTTYEGPAYPPRAPSL